MEVGYNVLTRQYHAMKYRRAFIPGGSFFLTSVTEKHRPLFHSADAVGTLRRAFQVVKLYRPFGLDAIVILPDHLYRILLPRSWLIPKPR